MAQQSGQQRFRRAWGYIRLALLVILTLFLIVALATQDWGSVAPTAIFIVLLAFLEAMDRGWLRRFGVSGPPDTS